MTARLLALCLLIVPSIQPELQAQIIDRPEGRPAEPQPRAVGIGDDYDHESAPRAQAIRTQVSIDLDGRLDEPVWTEVPPVTDFIQEDPAEGEPVTQRTEFRIVYDDVAIYIGALLYDENLVTTRLARRDPARGDFDFIQVSLDSYHDHETVYLFGVNPSGTRRDAVLGGGGGGRGGRNGGQSDSSWDPVWDAATQITSSGWSAEFRIPFSQLRFRPDEKQVWGIRIERNIHLNQERATFPFIPTLETAGPSRFAHLDGIEGIEPGRRLEFLPYVAGRSEYLQLTDPAGINFANPFRSGSDHFAAAGLDLKYRLASNVTIDATVNPDFGQVELDPSVINLTAFETRYQERRPFFVEGADIFRFGEGGPGGGGTMPAPQLVYSRRIGRSPTGSAPDVAVFSDAAPATTILGAAKVTGRVGDGWSLGLLEAMTAQEVATYVDADELSDEAVIEPAANYLAGRLRKQSQGGETRFGLMGTAVNRDLGGTGTAGRLHSAAYTGGLDFAHEWSNRTYFVSGTVATSYVQGKADAITRTQRSSARYYQRPDADYLSLDPGATSLSGYYAGLTVAKQAGAFGARMATAASSPGYEVNDMGFQTTSDRLVIDTNLSYSQPNPGRILRQWSTRGSPDAMWNYAGDRVWTQVNANFNWEFLNYWGGDVRIAYDPPHDDDRLTRGGPLARTPTGFAGIFRLHSDGRRALVGTADYEWAVDRGDSWSRNLRFTLTATPSEGLEISLGPVIDWRYQSAQYVISVLDPLASHTFGRRYVFAGLDQTTVSMDARVNVTFTPNLSLQLYAEPFISTGDYEALKEFERPGSFRFLEYGEDLGTISQAPDGSYLIDPDGEGAAATFTVADEDFNYRSLLGNAVLRWEWRPGSTLFFVWQQRRINSLTGHGIDGANAWVGGFDLGRDAGDMFGTRPDNIFVIKVNYWLNP